MNKAAIPLILFIGMVAIFLFMLNKMNQGEYSPSNIPSELINKRAPSFKLPNLYNLNKNVESKNYDGQIYLLNIWGSWCPECWREHSYLMRLKSQGIVIIGLNWRDQVEDAKNMLQRLGDPYKEIAFDPNSQSIIDYGVYGAPETFLIDSAGIIREKHKGILNDKIFNEKFIKYFNKKL